MEAAFSLFEWRPEAANSPADRRSAKSIECGICGDRATGKHYGAVSCDGCKGFFRRSVRKSHQYQCRFNRDCTVDRDKRNQCRFCRLEKCFKAGMRKQAVQKERDVIGGHPPGSLVSEPGDVSEFEIDRMSDAEGRSLQLQAQYEPSGFCSQAGHSKFQEAGLNVICSCMQHQLLLMVEWAKSFQAFARLNVEEQAALLRAHAGEILLLGVAFRSLTTEPSLLPLGGSFCVSAANPDRQLGAVVARVVNEVVEPLKEMEIDFKEFSCFKAVLFFDPDSHHLPQNVSARVRRWRHRILQNMQEYMATRFDPTKCRFAELLLLLPKLQSVNDEVIKQVHKTREAGEARIESLLQELLLGGELQPAAPTSGTFTAEASLYNHAGPPSVQHQADGGFHLNDWQTPNAPIIDMEVINSCINH